MEANLAFARIEKLLARFFWVLPLVGFVLGWASFLLVQRGEALAAAAALLALLGWPWILAEPFILRYLLGDRNPGLNMAVANFFTQGIQQEILFFSLAFLLAATHLQAPGQVVFSAICVLAALVSIIDPVYEKYIHADRIANMAFHAFCCFIAALVILPLVTKLPTQDTLLFALGFIAVWLVLALPSLLARIAGWKHRTIALLAIAAIPAGIWLFRASIPAAGILVTNAVITTGVRDHEPVDVVARFEEAELAAGVYAYVAVRAPSGLSQEILFRWRHGDYKEDIPAEILGGRAEGYRTYSLKNNFRAPVAGLWTVDVLTSQGQLLEHLEFMVGD